MSHYRRLTPHFTYSEMTQTDTGLPNVPDDYAFHNLFHTCRHLEAIRAKCGFPLLVSSGYRSAEVNSKLRELGYEAAEHSYHLDGRAVDILTSHLSEYDKEKLYTAVYSQIPSEFIIKQNIIHIAF